jgi:hypothetical protein
MWTILSTLLLPALLVGADAPAVDVPSAYRSKIEVCVLFLLPHPFAMNEINTNLL